MCPHTLPTVLVALWGDDDRVRVSQGLGSEFDALTAPDIVAARAAMADNFVQVLITDPWTGAQETAFRHEIEERWPETVRLVIGKAADDDDALSLFQVLPGTADGPQLRLAARTAARHFQLGRENQRLATELKVRDKVQRAPAPRARGFEAILYAQGSPLTGLIDAARQYATFDLPVLLTGEDGTGKADLARAIHHGSLRSDCGFFSFDLRGLSDEALALELFGARNGSVPKGHRNKIGLVQKADRGTLYLAGIESLSTRMQTALLRTVSDGSFEPVGGHEPVTTRMRLIAGTDTDLAARVREGRFRADLYHAISVAPLALPPLRERRIDIPLLAQKMLFDAAARHGKPVHGLSDTALAFLSGHDWPGNLRDLQNEITRMLVFATDPVLGPELISRPILQVAPRDCAQSDEADPDEQALMTGDGTLKERVERIEARILRETLTRHKWNKSRAASELGLSRVGLRAKLDRYGVSQPDELEPQEG